MRNRLKDGWQDDIKKLLPEPTQGGEETPLGPGGAPMTQADLALARFHKESKRFKLLMKRLDALLN